VEIASSAVRPSTGQGLGFSRKRIDVLILDCPKAGCQGFRMAILDLAHGVLEPVRFRDFSG